MTSIEEHIVYDTWVNNQASRQISCLKTDVEDLFILLEELPFYYHNFPLVLLLSSKNTYNFLSGKRYIKLN